MKSAFVWGLIFGMAVSVILLGHNGILRDEVECDDTVPVQVLVGTPDTCAQDLPTGNLHCWFIDRRGNHVKSIRF